MNNEKNVYEKYEELRAKQWISNNALKVEKVHAKGKYTAQERLEMLFDDGRYTMTNPWARNSCVHFDMYKKDADNEGVITAIGEVDGRRVCAFSHDAFVYGGSGGEGQLVKVVRLINEAIKIGVPLVSLNDASGARVQEGVAGLNAYCSQFGATTVASGWIPHISVILGAAAGGTAYAAALTDFIIMVNPISKMFITGPSVIKAVTGEDVTFDDLGGCAVHGQVTGTAHFVVNSEDEAMELSRRLLSFLPSNSGENPPIYACDDPADRSTEELRNIIPLSPTKAFDMKEVIHAVVDNEDFLEVQADFAKSVIVGLARMNGSTVGIVANQPKVLAGCLDCNASWKAARFVRFCDAFNIPILTFADCPGYLPGISQEHGGIIRNGAKLIFAYAEATVPKITIVVRKDYGGAYSAMCGKGMGSDVVLALPTGELAVMGAEGAANLVFKKEIASAEDQVAKRKEMTEAYREEYLNPYRGAEYGIVDDVIMPDELREQLCTHLKILESKKIWSPNKKHSNIPL